MRFFHKKKKKKPTTLALDEGLEQGPFFPEPLDTKQAVWFYCTVAQWLRAACPQLMSLDLSFIGFGDEGAKTLAPAINAMASVTSVSVTGIGFLVGMLAGVSLWGPC